MVELQSPRSSCSYSRSITAQIHTRQGARWVEGTWPEWSAGRTAILDCRVITKITHLAACSRQLQARAVDGIFRAAFYGGMLSRGTRGLVQPIRALRRSNRGARLSFTNHRFET